MEPLLRKRYPAHSCRTSRMYPEQNVLVPTQILAVRYNGPDVAASDPAER